MKQTIISKAEFPGNENPTATVWLSKKKNKVSVIFILGSTYSKYYCIKITIYTSLIGNETSTGAWFWIGESFWDGTDICPIFMMIFSKFERILKWYLMHFLEGI